LRREAYIAVAAAPCIGSEAETAPASTILDMDCSIYVYVRCKKVEKSIIEL
jgi:hypothetical protein